MSMENSPSAADKDRISELPEPLLHNILRFLSQKQAVQTCILSKSWRYLGSTRPNLEFVFINYNFQTFLSILDKTLLRYHEQKFSIQEFHVEMLANHESASFLKKRLPFIASTMGGVKTFDLSFHRWWEMGYFDLPSEVFENSKSLRNLRLRGFRFSQNLPMDYKVHNLKHLQTLTLEDVHIVDETFQNIISSCPCIERLVLDRCEGLTHIRLMNNNYLKGFDLVCSSPDNIIMEDLCLEDVPNLESMRIDHRKMYYFPRLKSLELTELRLPKQPSLDILSRDFPCLQHFYIYGCSGFEKLRVSNHSIKKLTISFLHDSTKVIAVDAPNIEVLDFSGSIPGSFSFTKTFNECTSKMKPRFNVCSEDGFLELRKLLEAVRESKIHLTLPHDSSMATYNIDEDDNHDDKPVLVEYFHLDDSGHGYFYSENFLNRMFRYCRPRNILTKENCFQQQGSRFLLNMLLFRRNNGLPYFYWQRDLEEASMHGRDQNSKEWLAVDGNTFFEFDYTNIHGVIEVLFKLKWRDL